MGSGSSLPKNLRQKITENVVKDSDSDKVNTMPCSEAQRVHQQSGDHTVFRGSSSHGTVGAVPSSGGKLLETLKEQCWSCKSWIQHPNSETKRNAGGDEIICLNALHVHVLLGVPVCAVCALKTEALEMDRISSLKEQKQQTKSEVLQNYMEDDESLSSCEDDISSSSPKATCCACGKQKEEFSVCDLCTRAICQGCVNMAYYARKDGGLRLQQLEPQQQNRRCICCWSTADDKLDDENPSESFNRTSTVPTLLRELRIETQRLFSTPTKNQTVEEALEELQYLVIEKETCERQLEEPENLRETAREKILAQRRQCNERLVDKEVQKIHQLLADHHFRLEDKICILIDRLKSDHGIEGKTAFLVLEEQRGSNSDEDSKRRESSDDFLEEPSWKRDADKFLAQRDRENQKKKRKYDVMNDPRYSLEITADVEVLGSSESSDESTVTTESMENEDFNSGWRYTTEAPRKEEINAARVSEDARRLEHDMMPVIVCRKRADEEEIKEWSAGLEPPAAIRSYRPRKRRRKRLPTRDRFCGVTKRTSQKLTPHEASTPREGGQISFSQPNQGNVFSQTSRTSCTGTYNEKAFQHSDFLLSKDPLISIDMRIEKHLKKHQREGIKFIFRNSFADDEAGCILAHSMGLGKSLVVVSILHAVMLQPAPVEIRKVLLVVPVNTIVNWENEFDKWTKEMQPRLDIFNVSISERSERFATVKDWSDRGGILLTSDAMFRNMMEKKNIETFLIDANAIVLDESHTMLKKKGNKLYKALTRIETKRRICLTGTPFQNNLREYYHMILYIRPKLFGKSEKDFQKEYIDPIEAGLALDAPMNMKVVAETQLESLYGILKPHVHRRDASILRSDLPPLQQVCLHVRPTTQQRALSRAYREYKMATDENNFFKQFVSLRLVHNHPGTLLRRNTVRNSRLVDTSLVDGKIPDRGASVNIESNYGGKSMEEIFDVSSTRSSDVEDFDGYESDEISTDKWWEGVAERFGVENMNAVESGNKVVLFLHIVIQATLMSDEKVVVFSQSLKTLDFLSEILTSKNWSSTCPSLTDSFPDETIGRWVEGKDFVRIDGTIAGSERGRLMRDFSDRKGLKLFLISSKAGGIGTNLVAANRVILFDSSFNPTIDLQAIYRCYRYGQKRSVFVYRFMTHGSMEEKVYSRGVTKIGLGNRVVDGKELERCYNEDEINSLARIDDWVQCVNCKSWRMFPPDHNEDTANLQGWVCSMMNKHDRRMKTTCSSEVKDSAWYDTHYQKRNEKLQAVTKPQTTQPEKENEISNGAPNEVSSAKSKELLERDTILQSILPILSKANHSMPIVTKYFFQEAIASESDSLDPKEKKAMERCHDNMLAKDGEGVPFGTDNSPEGSLGIKVELTDKKHQAEPIIKLGEIAEKKNCGETEETDESANDGDACDYFSPDENMCLSYDDDHGDVESRKYLSSPKEGRERKCSPGTPNLSSPSIPDDISASNSDSLPDSKEYDIGEAEDSDATVYFSDDEVVGEDAPVFLRLDQFQADEAVETDATPSFHPDQSQPLNPSASIKNKASSKNAFATTEGNNVTCKHEPNTLDAPTFDNNSEKMPTAVGTEQLEPNGTLKVVDNRDLGPIVPDQLLPSHTREGTCAVIDEPNDVSSSNTNLPSIGSHEAGFIDELVSDDGAGNETATTVAIDPESNCEPPSDENLPSTRKRKANALDDLASEERTTNDTATETSNNPLSYEPQSNENFLLIRKHKANVSDTPVSKNRSDGSSTRLDCVRVIESKRVAENAKAFFKKKIDEAIKSNSIRIVLSGNNIDTTAFFSMFRGQVHLCKHVDENTTVCIVPDGSYRDEAGFYPAKVLGSALMRIPIVRLDWIRHCMNHRKIVPPDEFIFSLQVPPDRIEKCWEPRAENGLAKLATSEPIFRNTRFLLWGHWTNNKKKRIVKLLKSGGGALTNNLDKKDASSTVATESIPRKYVIVTNNVMGKVPTGKRKEIEDALKTSSSPHIYVVDHSWLCLSTICGKMLEPASFKPDFHEDLWILSKNLFK